MECSEVRIRISEYEKGRLEVSTSEMISAHLQTCSRCTDELNSLREINAMLSMEKPVYPHAAFTESVMKAVLEEKGMSRAKALKRSPVLTFGASLVLAGLLTIFINTPFMSGFLSKCADQVAYSTASVNTRISDAAGEVETYINNIFNPGGK
jgi:anti-sigma factor RsiW